jgi:HEAT repeat protein
MAMQENTSDWRRKLSSGIAGVRSHAAWQLGQLRDTSTVPALIQLLQSDENEDVRLTAAWALGELGDSAATLALEDAREADESADMRTQAWEALRALREKGPTETRT